jgi:hypothetical protein
MQTMTTGRSSSGCEPTPPTSKLLAVDCGLRTGLALYDVSGKLLWYRSHNFGNRTRMRKAVWQILKGIDGLVGIAVEGGGPLAAIWIKEAERRGCTVTRLQAETWRRHLLLPRQQRSGRQAKQVAVELAGRIIVEAGLARPSSLRHDAAEAILAGWWQVRCAGHGEAIAPCKEGMDGPAPPAVGQQETTQ